MQPVADLGTAPSPIGPSALFDEHLDWAAAIGRKVRLRLPPSFDEQDLEQIARIEHWRRVHMFDPSVGVPYRAYASRAIFGAVQMACRRRHYREATHDEISDRHVDGRLNPEARLLAREERRNVTGPASYHRRQRVLAALAQMKPGDADLVRAVLSGADVEQLEGQEPGIRRRLAKAVRELRRIVAQPPAPANSSAAPVVPIETIRAALPSLQPADAYLLQRVHMDGVEVAELAAVWNVEASFLASRLQEATKALSRTDVAAGYVSMNRSS